MAERQRPGAAPAAAETATAENGKQPRRKAKYHIYEDRENVLHPLGEFEGTFAENAVGAFIETPGEHSELAEQVKKGDATLVVVPDRNLTRVTAQVETKTKVKLTAV